MRFELLRRDGLASACRIGRDGNGQMEMDLI